MKRLLLASLAAAFASIAAAQTTAWTNLFAGTSYEDFYFDFLEETEPKEIFTIGPDGTLKINGHKKTDAYLQTLDEYENYELKLQFRWAKAPVDPDEEQSGIQIHSTSDISRSIWPEGIEIQLQKDNVGDIWLHNAKLETKPEQLSEKSAERNRRIKLEEKPKSREERFRPKPKPTDWRSLHIIARGDTLKVMLDGKRVNEGKTAKPASGYITFRAEGADIEFRNVQIRSL